MALDILTFGEALVEVMRTDLDQPLDQPALFTGPYPSGAPFIFAAQAARLGAQVGAIGAVGADAFGRCLLDQLHTDGIETSGVRMLDTHTTGVAFVAYESSGARDFVFHVRGAAAGQLTPDLLDERLFTDLKLLHIMGSTLSIHEAALAMGLRSLELARQTGAKISFDPNLRPQLMPNSQAKAAFAPFIAAADILIPTSEEAKLLTGTDDETAAVDVLLAQRPERIVVITRGAAGCTVYTQDQVATIPGFTIEEIDPTGAGDCFDAGFVVRWLAGDAPAEAARFANACGALAVNAKGPMAGARPLKEVHAFITSSHSQ
ncbi:MAG: sugar kinase [Chloroflexi bacterium]|nr:sugar kinase [Chloroflexota bacterium]